MNCGRWKKQDGGFLFGPRRRNGKIDINDVYFSLLFFSLSVYLKNLDYHVL